MMRRDTIYLCMYIHMYIYVHTYVYIYAHTETHINAHMFVCAYKHIHHLCCCKDSIPSISFVLALLDVVVLYIMNMLRSSLH